MRPITKKGIPTPEEISTAIAYAYKGVLFIIPVHKPASLAAAVLCGYGGLQTGLQTGREKAER